MHPRKMYNPNRGKRHAARLPGHATKPTKGKVAIYWQQPRERGHVSYAAQ